MKKVELLSPVGNLETLVFAVHNGCNAVYFAGKKFGARKFADNFSDDEIIEAIKYCHLYGVKVYITVNTLVFNREIDEVMDYIKFLYLSGVDALIMQDIGLINLTHQMFPNLDIHISTQAHNHNDPGIKFFEELGAKRIVLDREMSLDEIKRLDTKLEKEVFVHGALCVSYSGCCLFSSLNGGRSGNRGECVASCRLPYELYKNDQKIKTDGDYLLSTKELNTLNHIKELIEAGITSFKIEGRMKSKEYVGFVTRLYRMAIDKYYNHEDPTISEEEIFKLKKLYNRQFTSGYLFNKSGRELMNIHSPNHIGTELGEVLSHDQQFIKIKLIDDLYQEDGLRFSNGEGMIVNRLYNNNKLLVNSLSKGEIAYLDNKVELKEKGKVLKTLDKNLIKELQKIEEKKIPIDVHVICKEGQSLEISVSDGKNNIKRKGIIIEKAINSPTTKERIILQVSKLGNTPFSINKLTFDIDDGIFVPIQKINDLRREIIAELTSIRENKKRDIIIKEKEPIKHNKINSKVCLNVLVRNEKQLIACLNKQVDNIYTDDKALYLKYKNQHNIFLRLPRVNLKEPLLENEKLVITEIGSIINAKNNDVVADYTINATNSETISTLENNGVKLVTLSPEITDEYLNDTNFKDNNVELIIYGTMELMIMKYCPLKMLENNDGNNCNLCSLGNKYYLKNKNDECFPIINTKHYTHIMHKEPLNKISHIKKYIALGINNFRLELFEEDEKTINSLIDQIRMEIDN